MGRALHCKEEVKPMGFFRNLFVSEGSTKSDISGQDSSPSPYHVDPAYLHKRPMTKLLLDKVNKWDRRAGGSFARSGKGEESNFNEIVNKAAGRFAGYIVTRCTFSLKWNPLKKRSLVEYAIAHAYGTFILATLKNYLDDEEIEANSDIQLSSLFQSFAALVSFSEQELEQLFQLRNKYFSSLMNATHPNAIEFRDSLSKLTYMYLIDNANMVADKPGEELLDYDSAFAEMFTNFLRAVE